jgi:hypothetical protein
MAPTTDPIAILQRLSALRGAGRAVPRDLTDELLNWIGGAAPLILNGTPVAEALNLRPAPGSWSSTPVRKSCYAQRDDALAVAFALATGSQEQRGDAVIAWWGEFSSGKALSPPVAEAMQEVAQSGVAMPTDARTVARRVRTRAGLAHAVIDLDESATMKL